MGKHDMITSIGYREGSSMDMNKKTITEVKDISSEFKFSQLNKPLDSEVLDLKNDVLKLCDKMDTVEQGLINLNHKLKTKLDYQMKFIEKINKSSAHSINEIWLEIEKLVK